MIFQISLKSKAYTRAG